MLLFLLLVLGDRPISDVEQDQTVLVFPTWGHLDAKAQEWVIPLRAWVYESSLRGSVALAALKESVDIEGKEAARIFQRRAAPFFVDNEGGRRLAVRIGNHELALQRKTESHGHVRETLRLPVGASLPASGGEFKLRVLLPSKDGRVLESRVWLLPARGISIVSDIDDTIKVTEVTQRRRMLANTFTKPFRPVPGMAQVYARWREQGAAFHYVTGSPWQLYVPLSEFLEAEQFPRGSFQMKRFRLTDSSLVDLLASQTEYKLAEIKSLLEAFPERRFVLVGDSGEQDPEVYGELGRRYPQQVWRIFIREVSAAQENGADKGAAFGRYQAAFRGVPADRWRVFRAADELPSLEGG